MLISGAALLCFPREMPEYRKKRVLAMTKGKLPAENKDIGKGGYQNKGHKTEADPEGGEGGSSPGQILNPYFSNN